MKELDDADSDDAQKRLSGEYQSASTSSTSPPSSPKSSPPARTTQYAVWRANSRAAALKRAQELDDTMIVFRGHAKAQTWTYDKILKLLCHEIIADTPALARLVNRPDSCFAHINSIHPLTAPLLARNLMADYVRHNVDNLIEEIRQVCANELAERRNASQDELDTRDVCSAARIKMLTNTDETLRLIANFQLMNERLISSSLNMLRWCRWTQHNQFAQNFDVRLYGYIDHRAPPENDAVCEVCTQPYTWLAGGPSTSDDEDDTMDEDRPALPLKNARLVLRCCDEKKSICIDCMSKHCFNNTNAGQSTTVQCPFARHQLPLYDHLEPPR